ncbi:MAG: hypothetical protein ACI4UN_04100, partial [Muribaculaceae bacterium]
MLAMAACSKPDGGSVAAEGMAEARGITITHCKGYTLVEVANPWRKGEVLHTYILVPRYASDAKTDYTKTDNTSDAKT